MSRIPPYPRSRCLCMPQTEVKIHALPEYRLGLAETEKDTF